MTLSRSIHVAANSIISFFLFFIYFFSFIFISWRLITLQYWSGFCHTFFLIVPISWDSSGELKDQSLKSTEHGTQDFSLNGSLLLLYLHWGRRGHPVHLAMWFLPSWWFLKLSKHLSELATFPCISVYWPMKCKPLSQPPVWHASGVRKHSKALNPLFGID